MSLINNDFGLRVARGLVSGITTINKFGRAPTGVQTTISDIWSRCDATPTQQIWVAPTAARIHTIKSTSASDDGSPVGAGARTIRIWGLTSWTADEVSEDITLDGTTDVNTANAYVIIHRMKVLTSGAASINVGNITATAVVDSTVTAEIAAGQGQTQMAIYGVPSTKSFYMTRFYAYINDVNTTRTCDIQLRVNENPNVQLTNFINKLDLQLSNSAQSIGEINYELPIKFAGPCIVKVQAIASTNDLDTSAGFDAYLVSN
jgi:hypothetical protein